MAGGLRGDMALWRRWGTCIRAAVLDGYSPWHCVLHRTGEPELARRAFSYAWADRLSLNSTPTCYVYVRGERVPTIAVRGVVDTPRGNAPSCPARRAPAGSEETPCRSRCIGHVVVGLPGIAYHVAFAANHCTATALAQLSDAGFSASRCHSISCMSNGVERSPLEMRAGRLRRLTRVPGIARCSSWGLRRPTDAYCIVVRLSLS